MMIKPLMDRFFRKVRVSGECWEWTSPLTTKGYAQFSIRGRRFTAHRLLYEAIEGQLPHKLQLDHLCRNRKCVRPSHLEAVTGEENNLRSNSITAMNARKTTCKNGHPFTHSSSRRRERLCRECMRSAWRAWYARKSRAVVSA